LTKLYHNVLNKFIGITNFGVHAKMNAKLAGKIQVTNVASLMHIFFTFPYFFVFYSAGAIFLAYYTIVLTLVFACISLINKIGFYNLSRCLLLGAINISVFIYASSLGEATQIQNIFFFTLIAPLMLFHIHETKWILFCVLQPVLLWPVLNLTGYHVVPTTQLPQEYILFISQIISVTNCMLLFYCTYYMFWAYQKAEDKLLTAKNIAERAQKKAEKLSKVKSEFLAMMSHELRTPLNGIIGATQLLAGNQDPLVHHKYTHLILTSGHLLLALINDILDFEKISAGKMRLSHGPFNIFQTIEETLDLMRPALEQKELQLNLHIDKNCPKVLVGDAMRVEQVLLNLLSNACKFTPKGFIQLRLDVLQKRSQQVELCISVQDSGIGISQDNLKKIFRPFSQAENFLQRKAGGTGLGLPISQHFAKLMKGNIEVESQQGHGSTFKFYCRLQEPTEEEKIQPQNLPTKILTNFPQYNKVRALVVEDDLVNQKVVHMMLQKFGITADIADNGETGVKMFQSQNYDIVLMDCSMPIMDGFEATKLIRELELQKKLSPTTIVAFTANTFPEDKQRCLASGMTDFIAKPTRIEAMATILRTYLSAS